MISFEEVQPGLEIARGAFRQEALTIVEDVLKSPEDEWSNRGDRDILVEANGSDLVTKRAFMSLRSIADQLLEGDVRGLFTRYRPGEHGGWHEDMDWMVPVHVLSLLDIEEPVFEYQTGEPQYCDGIKMDPTDDVASLTLSAGDILRVNRYDLTHRGLNPTDEYRYIGVFSR
ncbi:hypothetical protein KDA00_02330 [Candidatus Saccharibacteria bacterium]|nr:hypothetical protein [Candidatus Saccharibacteria bacterium]